MNRLTVWKNSVRQAIETYDCDYKPFGELDGGDEPTKHGFATAEYDGESSCFAMGMRMYSAEIGRFLSVDPLFEAMPRHTPYHYSFNSPLVWKDPSGLIPENEKDQDRLMERVSDDDLRFAYETYYESVEELQWKIDDMDNFVITTRSQLEWMVMQTDYLSNGYESSMIDGTLNVLYGRTGGSGSGNNGEYSIGSFTFDSKSSYELFQNYYDTSDKETKKNLDLLINDSENKYHIRFGNAGGANGVITYDFNNSRVEIIIDPVAECPLCSLAEELDHAMKYRERKLVFMQLPNGDVRSATLGAFTRIDLELAGKEAQLKAIDNYNKINPDNRLRSTSMDAYKSHKIRGTVEDYLKNAGYDLNISPIQGSELDLLRKIGGRYVIQGKIYK